MVSVCTEFHVCIVFRLARGRETEPQSHRQTFIIMSEDKNIPYRLLASRRFGKKNYCLFHFFSQSQSRVILHV